jgi:TPR repeat protein
MYRAGQGVAQDYSQAADWYRKAADQGDADAQYNLGLMYYNGNGVPQNYSQAAVWYRKAGTQGHSDSLNNLGAGYELGQFGWGLGSNGTANRLKDFQWAVEVGATLPERLHHEHQMSNGLTYLYVDG